ncbi:MAG: hypothetical protein WA755_09760 [Candidatus Acidiferrales bacterium]
MPNKDDYRKVARIIKKELDTDKLAFKTYQRDKFITELKAIAGAGAQAGNDTFEELEDAFVREGLLVFPGMCDTEEDGFTRVFRSGSRIAGVLNAIRFPGGGSDEELSALLGKLKAQSAYQQEN